jgi:hypothetical protein
VRLSRGGSGSQGRQDRLEFTTDHKRPLGSFLKWPVPLDISEQAT